MATPGKLVETMAACLGIPKATVVVHDRNLVAAGLRSKHGRGRGAAQVVARDAANLLTAILGSSGVMASAETVRRFGRTRPVRSRGKGFRAAGIAALRDLPADHCFVDVIETLFAAAADDICDLPGVIEIGAQNPVTIGDLRLAGLASGEVQHVRYAIPAPWGRDEVPSARKEAAWRAQLGMNETRGDLEESRKVTAQTFLAVGEILAKRR